MALLLVMMDDIIDFCSLISLLLISAGQGSSCSGYRVGNKQPVPCTLYYTLYMCYTLYTSVVYVAVAPSIRLFPVSH